MSAAADRKAEIERKKAKLLAMREEKKRQEERKKKGTDDTATPKPQASGSGESVDDILGQVGVSTATSEVTAKPPAESPSVPGGPPVTPTPIVAISQPKKVALGLSKVTQTNIPPKELVSYSKETQTHVEIVDREDDDDASLEVVLEDTMPHPHNKLPKVHPVLPAQTPDDLPPAVEEPPPVPEMSEEEKMAIMKTDEFARFLDRTTRVVERAMSENVDIFLDYSGTEEDDEGGLSEGEKLKLSRVFFDERWSKYRTITCMDWSVQHPELLVASYGNNEESPNDPDGVALIWNTKYKKTTPEYIFHCQSAVMSSCFAKFHPNLVVGGTYSGQIVLWDNRSNKRTPVQRTPLSAAAHTHPVYCVNVVGTQNAHNLISVSTDGKMCSWSLDMLSQPQDSMELQHKQSKAVAVTSFSFLSGDVNNFVVGSEEGAVYTACRHGSKAGIADMFEGHQGPVTGINCHSVPGSIDFSHYFITSSFDWTVKLWNIKENRPLHSFEDNSDYVYDARWSPIHPALFATVDGMGRLDLWNLNMDTEVPTASVSVDGNVALNRCRWQQNGQSIAVGDDMGKIHIYDVGEPLAVPRNDEWSKFVHTLGELKNQQAEQDDDPTSMSLLSSSLTSSPLR